MEPALDALGNWVEQNENNVMKIFAGLLASALSAGMAVGAELVLVPNWIGDLGKGSLKATDVYKVIGTQGSPKVDTSDHPIKIYNEITYMMPMAEALKVIRKNVGSKKVVTCPGFPAGTFFYYGFDGMYGPEGCNKLLLVVDNKDQVVAAQLVKETPKTTLLSGHSSEYSLYNFIETTAKGAPTWKIAHKSKLSEGLLNLQSEVLDSNDKPREYVRLLLPTPILDLVAITSDPIEAKKFASRKAPVPAVQVMPPREASRQPEPEPRRSPIAALTPTTPRMSEQNTPGDKQVQSRQSAPPEIFAFIAESVKSKGAVVLEPVGMTNVTLKTSGGPEGSLMIGAKLTANKFGANYKYSALASVQPIYLSQSGKVEGEILGIPSGNRAEFMAKDGYAVSEIQISEQPHKIGGRLRGMRFQFSRITGRGLDVDDSYLSEWYLTTDENLFKLGGNGRPIIGICGDTHKEMRALGITQCP